MKRITFFALFAGTLFLLAGVSYFFTSHTTKASNSITDVQVTEITSSGAKITWTTSVSSDSRVAYSTSPTNYGIISDSRCDSSGYVTSHCVNLVGISPNTTYYYRVESRDSTGLNSLQTGLQFTSAQSALNDPTLPSPPGSLAATLDTNGLDVLISWTDSTSSDSPYNESEFKIYNRKQGTAAWNYFISADGGTTSFTYPGHPYGTYEYYVVACSQYGCSAPSNVGAVTKSSDLDITAPSAPTNLAATVVSGSQVSLGWTASTDDVGVSNYYVYRNDIFLTKVSSPSYSDTGLDPSTLYWYVITAKDAAGNLSLKSNTVSATTFPTEDALADITPPVISTIDTKNIFDTSAQVTWTTDDPSDSKIVYGQNTGLYPFVSSARCDTGGDVVSHCVTLTGLSMKTTYYFEVISKNKFGFETISLEGSFVSGEQITATTQASSTTTKTLIPIAVLVKAGNPYCSAGFTVGGVSFLSTPANSSYFTLSGGRLSSPQSFTDGSGNVMPYGNYTWNAISKPGYVILGSTTGTLSIPMLSCTSSATSVVTATTAARVINTVVTNSTPKITLSPKTVSAITPVVKSIPLPSKELTVREESEKIVLSPAFTPAQFLQKVSIEEKQKLASDVRKEFGLDELVSLARSSEIQIGTTTISRQVAPELAKGEIVTVVKNRTTESVSKDTDRDGIPDYDEVFIYHTDPKLTDTSGNGINDSDKILLGMDPSKKEVVLVPREDPKEVTTASKIDSKSFSVDTVELVSATSSENGSTAKKYIALTGTGLPNSFVTLYIFSTPVVVTVKTDSDGKWKYTMDKELQDGSHEIYVAMTESAGKILMKSDPIPFVKTAQAAVLEPNFTLTDTSAKSPKGFFHGGMLTFSLVILFIILGFSLLVVSFVSKKRE